MIVYAESSAVLAWLFRQPGGAQVQQILQAAGTIVSSDLTLVECDRAIHREVAVRGLTRVAARQLSADLRLEMSNWVVLALTPAVVARAREPYPAEPIRSLDALHVAWALHAKSAETGVAILSLDDRIRRVSASLGFELLPA